MVDASSPHTWQVLFALDSVLSNGGGGVDIILFEFGNNRILF